MMAQTDKARGLVGNLGMKAPARAATTANITLSGLQTIDGITLAGGDRVLVKNQTNPVENGVYDATTSDWRRSADFDGSWDVAAGTTIRVNEGTVAAGVRFFVSGTSPIIPGTSSITISPEPLPGIAAVDVSYAGGPGLAATNVEAALDELAIEKRNEADDVALAAGKVVIFEGATDDAFETTLTVINPTADRAVALPDADTTLAGLAVAQAFTASQRGTLTTDNDLSFDQSVTNNFSCTPTAPGTLTFTNHTSGQGGFILLDNSGGYAISAAATTKVDGNFLATVSTAGVYLLSYFSNGTNTYVVTSGALA